MVYTISFDANEHLDRESEMNERLYGMGDYAKALIAIRPGMAPGPERQTLVHEVLHQILRQSGIGGLTAEDEETIIRHLESGLLGVIRDNPELIRYLSADVD